MQTHPKELFMGIDVGTQSARAGLCDTAGRLIGSASHPYATFFPQPGWAEQDPQEWWRSICLATRECLEKAKADPSSIAGISFDATSATVLMVDRSAAPLDRAILWMDQRAVQEVRDIQATGHPCLKYVGGQDSAEWMVPKVLWLKRNKPELFRRAYKVIEATDWIAHRLSGEWTASLCNATCKWNYVSREGGWDPVFFSELGLKEVLSKWPERVVPMGTRIGALTAGAAQDLGLIAGIPVAEGGIDAHVGLLGLNALDPGRMGLIMGSSNVAFVLSEQPVFSEEFWGPCPDAILEGTWLIEGGQTSTGSIINWLVDNIHSLAGGDEHDREAVLANLERGIDEVPDGARGLISLDYWQGNRTPRRDPNARGLIFGLTLAHDSRDLVKSIYEGICFGTRHIIDSWRSAGIGVRALSAGGGGTKSRFWLQLTADICNMSIIVPRFADSCGITGSAICAACGAGYYNSLREAAAAMVVEEKTILPSGDPSRFDGIYDRYLKLYEATRKFL